VTVDDLLLLLTDNSMLKKESSNQPPIYDQTYFKLRKLGDPKSTIDTEWVLQNASTWNLYLEKNTHTQFTVQKVASLVLGRRWPVEKSLDLFSLWEISWKQNPKTQR
jgi:hypothetical protein